MINACALTMERQQQSSLSGRAGKSFYWKDGKEARKERVETFVWNTHCCILAKGGSYFDHTVGEIARKKDTNPHKHKPMADSLKWGRKYHYLSQYIVSIT